MLVFPKFLGCQVIQTRAYSGIECSSNGLPLTPCSIRIVGRFQQFRDIIHPRLIQYIDCERATTDAVLFVSSFHISRFKDHVNNFSQEDILRYVFQILQAFSYLHSKNITHHCFDWEYIYLTPQNNVIIGGYALYNSTGGGLFVTFPIGSGRLLPPEFAAKLDFPHKRPIPETDEDLQFDDVAYDLWNLGVFFLELACDMTIWEYLTLREIFSKIISMSISCEKALNEILKCNNLQEKFKSLDPIIKDVITNLVQLDPTKRINCDELLKLFPVNFLAENHLNECINLIYPYNRLRSQGIEKTAFSKEKIPEIALDNLYSTRSYEEIYSLWKLAGGNLANVMEKRGLLRVVSAICRFPAFLSIDGDLLGNENARLSRFSSEIAQLPMDVLCDKLKTVDFNLFFPLLYKNCGKIDSYSTMDYENMKVTAANIKEVDLEYQLKRIVIFSRLLRSYPASYKLLLSQSQLDIPPLYRAYSWAALLHVHTADIKAVSACLDDIDFSEVLASDKQIEVDIPRCHQYSSLLTSPVAHASLRRVLRAWVIAHQGTLVYWQGLDSLAAPFVSLNITDSALAYSCLSIFIEKYSHNFFLADNSQVIHEYLSCFSRLISFHDPELYTHLALENFTTNLYAMSWFLTMFAHTFPLSKIYHLWDVLLLKNANFPLFIGVAILRILRDFLLSTDFDGCILLFSDIPEIEIDSIKKIACNMECLTPPSCLNRNFANPKYSYYANLPSNLVNLFPETEFKEMECSEEFTPRILPPDLLILLQLSEIDFPDYCNIGKYFVVDLRNAFDFQKGHLPKSVNYSLDFDVVLLDNEKTRESVLSAFQSLVVPSKKCLIVIVDRLNRLEKAREFCKVLVGASYSRVCLLHGGIEAFAHTGYLSVGDT